MCRELNENKKKWRLQDTAQALQRSLGSISNDLLVASWLRTHRDRLEKFEYLNDALEFIRKKEKEMLEEEIE